MQKEYIILQYNATNIYHLLLTKLTTCEHSARRLKPIIPHGIFSTILQDENYFILICH